MNDRIRPFHPERLPAEPRAVYERILSERGYVPGPYQFWLAAPEYANLIERVEAHLRYDVSLDQGQIELVVLYVARHWRAQYVWSSHEPAALKAGLEPAAIEALRAGREPALAREGDQTVFELCRALLIERDAPDEVWRRAGEVLGERGVNEVIGLIGLYTSVCLTMVGYRMPPRDGQPNPFE